MMISYAQNFEDVILQRVFHACDQGRYVDIGGYDPRIDSVTKHFYDRGWSGVNVEPVERFHQKFESSGPATGISTSSAARRSAASSSTSGATPASRPTSRPSTPRPWRASASSGPPTPCR